MTSSRQFNCSICDWEYEVPTIFGVKISFALGRRASISDVSKISRSSTSATKIPPSQILPAHNAYPRKQSRVETFWPNWWSPDWFFRRSRMVFCNGAKRIHWSFKWFSKSPFILCFPSARRSWTFRRQQWHSIESAHHFSSKPDCNSTAEVPSLILRIALSVIPFCLGSKGVDVQWFHDNSSQDLQNSKELSAWMTFGYSDGSRNFRKLPSISWEKFWFCTDQIESIECLNLVPRLRIGDCVEIHLLHWGLCDLMLSSHQSFLHEVLHHHRASLQGARVILVLLRISQFLSLGRTVPNLNPDKC